MDYQVTTGGADVWYKFEGGSELPIKVCIGTYLYIMQGLFSFTIILIIINIK